MALRGRKGSASAQRVRESQSAPDACGRWLDGGAASPQIEGRFQLRLSPSHRLDLIVQSSGASRRVVPTNVSTDPTHLPCHSTSSLVGAGTSRFPHRQTTHHHFEPYSVHLPASGVMSPFTHDTDKLETVPVAVMSRARGIARPCSSVGPGWPGWKAYQ